MQCGRTALPNRLMNGATQAVAMRPGSADLTLFERGASASVGALVTSLLVTPLDVVKTRLQAQAKQVECADARSPALCIRCTHYEFNNGVVDVMLPKSAAPALYECPHVFRNTGDALLKIARYEGVAALYNGLRPSLIMAVPSTVLYFSAYDALRARLRDSYGLGATAAPLLAGSAARVLAATVISPLELVRTKMQASSNPEAMVHMVQSQVRARGVMSLWQGLSPTLFRDVPFSAVYWVCVERCKPLLRPWLVAEATQPPSAGATSRAQLQQQQLQEAAGTGTATEEFMVSFASGGVGGMIAATLTNPFDVVKTRRQVFTYSADMSPEVVRAESSSLHIMRKIAAREGAAGFLVGLTPRLVKIVPACAIMLSSYEAGKKFFGAHAREPPS